MPRRVVGHDCIAGSLALRRCITPLSEKGSFMDTTLLCQNSNGQEDDWKNLYEISFPDDERMPVQEIRQLLGNGKMQLHKTLNKTNELLGFSLTFFPGSDFVLLSYIATDPTKRSGGVGSKHLKRLVDLLKAQFPTHLGLFLEIESTKEAGLDAEVQKMRNRRLAFYQRLGAKRLCKNYLMPSMVPGGKERPGELLWIEFGSPIDDSSVEHVIRDIYQHAYNLPATDPRVQQVLSQFVIKVPKSASTCAVPTSPATTGTTPSTGNGSGDTSSPPSVTAVPAGNGSAATSPVDATTPTDAAAPAAPAPVTPTNPSTPGVSNDEQPKPQDSRK
jgi:hypothetical protein